MKKKYTESDLEVFNKGVLEGKKHSSPSPETTNFIKTMKSEMREVKKDIKEILLQIAELPKKIIDETDDKYALKYVEEEVSEIKKARFVGLIGVLKIAVQLLISLGVAFLALKLSK